MQSDDRARRNSILGIDLLQEAAANRADETPGSRAPSNGSIPKADASFDNTAPSSHYGALQAVVDDLFDDKPDEYMVRRLDAIVQAEAADLPDELLELVNLLPPGNYSRKRLCTQLNSAIGGRAWGQVYGTVE